jgi:hypothetical protein
VIDVLDWWAGFLGGMAVEAAFGMTEMVAGWWLRVLDVPAVSGDA